MSKRRTVRQLANAAEDRLRLERARLETFKTKHQRAVLSTYAAAKRDRTNRDWTAKNTSADMAILPDHPLITARARQMVRDDAYAASTVRAFCRNVVGTGINVSPSAIDKSGKSLESFNHEAEALWWEWAHRPKHVDAEKRRDLAAIQRWAISEMITVGEAVIVESYSQRDETVGIQLQLVEAEQLDRYKTSFTDKRNKTHEVRGGVEVDEFGAAVAFWIYERHPNDVVGLSRPSPLMLESKRVPAERVYHIFDPQRARQTRGISRLSPVLERLRNLSTYDFAQLLAAKAEASIGFAITSDLQNADQLGMAQPDGIDAQDTDGNDELAMQPIMVARLQPGESITPFTPTRPGGQYEPFVMAQLRATAAGAGVSYEQVARDFSQGNYSSQRQGLLEDRREYEPMQQLLISLLLEPLYERFIEAAVLEGRLSAPGYWKSPETYHYAEWRGQGWEWIDPQKEAAANKETLDAGLDTKRRVLLAKGLDWREVARQRAIEIAFEKSLGLPEPTKADPNKTEQPPDATQEDEGDEAAPAEKPELEEAAA